MSLDTYVNLKAEIIDWSHRDDLNTRIDSFIDLAETEMLSNTVEPLRLRATETLVDFFTNTTTRFAALPSDYQSGRKLRIQGTETEILADPEFDTASAAGVDTADYTIPANASITGGVLVFTAAETATGKFSVEVKKYRLEYEIAVAALTTHTLGGVSLNLTVGVHNHQITTTATTAHSIVSDTTSELKYFRMREIDAERSDPLRFRTPEQLNIRNASDVGMPSFFTITDQIEFDRISDQVYPGELQYYADFTALSSSNTTNTVLTNNPNIYLFGSLWALRMHTEQPDSAARYYQMFINAIKGANLKDKMGRYGPAPVMRVEGSTP